MLIMSRPSCFLTCLLSLLLLLCCFFFFNDTATTEIYTLSLHDALPISQSLQSAGGRGMRSRALHGSGVRAREPLLAGNHVYATDRVLSADAAAHLSGWAPDAAGVAVPVPRWPPHLSCPPHGVAGPVCFA